MNEPLSDQNSPRTGLLLLSGFLGAGKTTLLKRILSWETDLAGTVILVNEFGDIGIDGSLLKDSGSDVIELTSGCICCTLSADFKRSLMQIWQRFKPRRILIESSGVADPKSLVSILNQPDLYQLMVLKKIITVLDADFWEARKAFGPLFHNQLEVANLILLNKVDLLAKNKIPLFLEQIHNNIPDSQVVPTIHCAVDPETIWAEPESGTLGIKPIRFYQKVALKSDSEALGKNDAQFDYGDCIPLNPQGSPIKTHYVTFSFKNRQFLDETRFKQFLEQLPWEVFRIKGPVRFADRQVMLNFVGGKSEWLEWEGETETRLAFIGWEISPEEILHKAARCIVEL